MSGVKTRRPTNVSQRRSSNRITSNSPVKSDTLKEPDSATTIKSKGNRLGLSKPRPTPAQDEQTPIVGNADAVTT